MHTFTKVGLDALLTPENCAVLLIDHQPSQLANVNSHEPTMVINNVTALAKTARAYGIPTILTTIKRMFNLAIQSGKLLQKPHIPFLKENNVRVGFFEREQFLSVLQRLPEPVRPVATFAYITGWRIDSEVLPLEWRQVDFGAGEVRLDPGKNKNGEGRTFPMTRELREVLEHQPATTENLQRQLKVVCPRVFHRSGRPIKSFRVAFRTACAETGCRGRVLHDFRRSAVRNLVRAGVPERVAMQMTGHKTRSVFERYNIVSAGDLREAAKRLDAATGTMEQNRRSWSKV